ncbi:antibiotic biosynthesis monooxygenase family protein [Aeromicrobium stalagmiti]|uniref:antibiotic biosynthesis monooxygenase family protein n=1 Tax=Aeromicrobium stalagmiti TaxID=2738988 RepID=UPI00156845FD|nr:antibiotic biosynthesis monooxygenase [Aeromicrobium stalagmiti]NRQ48631.1 antibiotic biosynthesis monooxygenase [Aeromicrobium stalagmiti]
MIVEQGILRIVPGEEAAFELAMESAKTIIAAMPGFRRLQVSRGIEASETYLLLVEWDTLEDHTQGFRGSVDYERWRSALHHFYDPFPVIEHFAPVIEIDRTIDKV